MAVHKAERADDGRTAAGKLIKQVRQELAAELGVDKWEELTYTQRTMVDQAVTVALEIEELRSRSLSKGAKQWRDTALEKLHTKQRRVLKQIKEYAPPKAAAPAQTSAQAAYKASVAEHEAVLLETAGSDITPLRRSRIRTAAELQALSATARAGIAEGSTSVADVIALKRRAEAALKAAGFYHED